MTDWHRADHGDLPAVGQIVSVVKYPAGQESVQVIERMAVAVVMAEQRRFFGPSLPFVDDSRIKLPGRPTDIVGKAGVFWRETR